MIFCPKCSTKKPPEGFSNDRNRKTGKYPYCKECVKRYSQKWYANNQPREAAKRAKYTANNLERERVRKLAWAAAHPEKTAAAISEWQRRNPEKMKAYSLKYEQSSPGIRAVISALYRGRNPDKVRAMSAAWREANRERFREMGRQWALNNPVKSRAKNTRYIALKLRAVPAWADAAKIEEIYAAKFAAEELFGIRVHVDHSVPIRSKFVCGLHCEDNLRLMPALDNQVKSNRVWPDMWGQ